MPSKPETETCPKTRERLDKELPFNLSSSQSSVSQPYWSEGTPMNRGPGSRSAKESGRTTQGPGAGAGERVAVKNTVRNQSAKETVKPSQSSTPTQGARRPTQGSGMPTQGNWQEAAGQTTSHHHKAKDVPDRHSRSR